MKTLKCAIIDDELLAISYLKEMLSDIGSVEVVKSYIDPALFVEESASLALDFCLCDVIMPGMTGLEVAASLADLPVVIVSAHHNYAADAYDLSVVDYVRKPVDKTRLEQAIQRVRTALKSAAPKKIFVNTARGKMQLSATEILRITVGETDSRDKLVTLGNGQRTLLKNYNFEQLEELFGIGQFVRISRNELVNKTYIAGMDRDKLLLRADDGEIEVTVGENYRTKVRGLVAAGF